MSDQLKESLSAVMDGEADDFEMRRSLDEMSNDPALRGVWERYHLIGSLLRREGRGTANSLGARFWERIDAGEGAMSDDIVESTVVGREPRKARWSPWGQRVAGVAVAAGVAAAVIVGFREDQSPVIETAKVAVVEAAIPAPSMALFDDETRDQAVPAALDVRRAHAYMIHHARHVALNNRSVVPFVKVAAFETK